MAADGEDVLSFGPTQWRRTWLLVPLAVGSLLLGYLWGSAGTEPVDAAAQERDPTEVLVAGVVRESFAIDDDLSFDVVLRNTGADPLEVTVRRVGRVEVVQPERPGRIPGHASRTLEFTVPTTCPFGSAGSLAELTADVGGGGSRRRQVTVPVLEAADLAGYVATICARPTTETRASVAGLWVLEESFTRWTADEGILLMWLRPDGTFVVDNGGRLFTRDAATAGVYSVSGSRLSLVSRDGLACARGNTNVWDVHRRSATVISLRYVSGSCPREPGGVWVLSRVLPELPGVLEP